MEGCVRAQVMLFQPIALDEQAKDLLRAGQYEQALALATVCAADGAPWAETAFAQAALLLLHGTHILAMLCVCCILHRKLCDAAHHWQHTLLVLGSSVCLHSVSPSAAWYYFPEFVRQ